MVIQAREIGADGSLKERVYRAMRDEIVATALPPGEELYEARLAARYGVSKTPVREALALLCREGLVQVLPRRGYRVAEVTARDVEECFRLRLLLEPEAARLAAAAITPAGLGALRALIEAERRRELVDPEANALFHMQIARTSNSGRLVEEIGRLIDAHQRMLWLVPEHRRPHAETEHELIVLGLASGDPEAARAAMEAHIRISRARVMRHLP